MGWGRGAGAELKPGSPENPVVFGVIPLCLAPFNEIPQIVQCRFTNMLVVQVGLGGTNITKARMANLVMLADVVVPVCAFGEETIRAVVMFSGGAQDVQPVHFILAALCRVMVPGIPCESSAEAFGEAPRKSAHTAQYATCAPSGGGILTLGIAHIARNAMDAPNAIDRAMYRPPPGAGPASLVVMNRKRRVHYVFKSS